MRPIALTTLALVVGVALVTVRSATPTISNAEAVKGVWILAGNSGTAIDTAADLEKLRPNLDDALALEGVKGFSLRVTWRSIHEDLALLEAGKRLADAKGLAFSFRVLAGYRVPDALFTEGGPFYFSEESRGRKIPTPFNADGTPNTVFERHYDQMVARVAAWSRANGVRLIHCPWYGMSWAELNHHVSVRDTPGYSYDRWFDAHIRLLDIALRHADDQLAVEFPFSGGGPTGDTVAQIADYAWTKLGANNDRFFFQANGWGPGGYWGSPSREMEMLKRRAFDRPVLRGLQSIRQGAYDWKELFALLRAVDATYCEIYAETLRFAGADVMKEESRKWADELRASSTPLPKPVRTPAPPDTMHPAISNAAAVAGTWATQQTGGHKSSFGSKAEFDAIERTVIRPALATPGVKGFSHRLPWFEIDQSLALAERGLALAREMGVDYSLRFMAGRYTPERVYKAGSRSLVLDEEGSFNDSGDRRAKVPVPFNADGSPNLVFEQEYEKFVAHLAGWSRANGVRLLHLPWPGGLWDELYHGQPLRDLEGYTYDRWFEAHRRLLDIGLRQAGRSLAIEYPFSGHGPTADTVMQLAGHVQQRIGTDNNRFFFQANGWGPQGRWGSPNEEMESMKSRVFALPLYRALQMIQPDDYSDWSGVYRRLRETNATYAEVYCPSFVKPHKADLAREVAAFAEQIAQHGPLRPAESKR